MRKFAFLTALAVLCAALSAPLSAAPDSSAGEPASSASSDVSSSSLPSGSSSASSASRAPASSDNDSGGAPPAGSASGSDSPSNYPPPFADTIYSKAVYMLNLDSGSVVYEKNAQEQIDPASLTKIMTCILALENVNDLDNEKTSLKASIQNELYNLRVDTLGGIYMGEELSIRDLLYAMMLQSANEAAMMVADYVGDGSIDNFCEMMNKKAKEIGAVNTNFSNATGLYDENNYSTAYDLSLIAKYAMENPEFVQLVTTRIYTSQPTAKHPDGITWSSINYMQNPSNPDYYYEGLRGIKTGTLDEQNLRNFASTATRDGYTYLLVLLGAPTKDDQGQRYRYNLSFMDAQKLYDWAFSTFTVKTLMNVGDEVAEVSVKLSWDIDHIKLLAADKFASLVPNETTADAVVPIPEIPEWVDAPIAKGQEIGVAKLMLGGEEVGRVRLVAAQSVERSEALYYLDMAKRFLNTFLFKFVVTFLCVILILYIILMIIRNRNLRRYQTRRKHPPNRR